MKPKKNGFTPPYHIFQISSWIATILEILISSLCILPFLNKPLTYAFCLSYYPIQSLEIIIGILATLSNPSINKESLSLTRTNFYCTICKIHVREDTKHCATCYRCVDRFDHHCKWLNNCIGRKNYKIFICLLPIVSLTLADLIIWKLIVITNGFLYGLGIDQNIEDLILALLFLFLIIDIIGFLGIIYLELLHFWLWIHKMTTYELIVHKKRAKKLQKVKPKSITSENSLNDYESARNLHKHANIPELEILNVEKQKGNQTFQEGVNNHSFIELKPPMSTRYSSGKGFNMQDLDLNDTIN